MEGEGGAARRSLCAQWTMGKEIKQLGKTKSGIQVEGKDRNTWREFVAALYVTLTIVMEYLINL